MAKPRARVKNGVEVGNKRQPLPNGRDVNLETTDATEAEFRGAAVAAAYRKGKRGKELTKAWKAAVVARGVVKTADSSQPRPEAGVPAAPASVVVEAPKPSAAVVVETDPPPPGMKIDGVRQTGPESVEVSWKPEVPVAPAPKPAAEAPAPPAPPEKPPVNADEVMKQAVAQVAAQTAAPTSLQKAEKELAGLADEWAKENGGADLADLGAALVTEGLFKLEAFLAERGWKWAVGRKLPPQLGARAKCSTPDEKSLDRRLLQAGIKVKMCTWFPADVKLTANVAIAGGLIIGGAGMVMGMKVYDKDGNELVRLPAPVAPSPAVATAAAPAAPAPTETQASVSPADAVA